MKKLIVLVSLIVLGCTTSLSAFAGAGWRGESKIAEILINFHNQGAAIRFENSVALNDCSVNNEVILNRTMAGYNEIYSTLLAAYAAKKTVNIWVTGSCENYRNIVFAISVKD
jgi:hypothetical protein